MTNDDERIRRAFDDLKNEDGRQRTTYAAVLKRGEQPRAKPSASPILRVAALLMVIVAASATYTLAARRKSTLVVPRDVTALMAWRPETDALLSSPTALLKSQARIRGSMIDLDTLTTGALP